ncbi:migration and invasion enhancer 1 [Uranotaenia lowii]|uniref:migration and invasion enhancer 1 n=1 Tax=Uranotaenia lowii TaxID=190385 RepID=UPI00247A22B4|nr:migration and invasion enhancer 1 [Uranotaenia lowii]
MEEKSDDGIIKVDIEYCNICNSKPQCLALSRFIEERLPGVAVVTCTNGRRGSFEVQINKTLVHSRLQSLAFPDYEAVLASVTAAQQGRPLEKVPEQPITDCVVQ